MSNLLEQASLVLIPSGYKEDVVYSQIPLDGSGDMAFTRASNGTRINSQGLVEVCPWNLVQQSETFDNAVWGKYNATVTTNSVNAPNGTLTADTATMTTDGYISRAVTQTGSVTYSCYAKKKTDSICFFGVYDGATRGIWFNFDTGAITQTSGTISNQLATSEGNGWYRLSFTFSRIDPTAYINAPYPVTASGGFTRATDIYIWGAQLNIGSTAKPYFPTTDRLNVPRLTYQNGGGGCPSLLLEKQSTNLLSWSEDLTNAVYLSAAGAGGSITRTANYAISPDGTQNADRLQFVRGSSYAELYQRVATTIGVTYTFSFYAKSLSGTPTLNTAWNGTQANEVTFTTEWVRYTYTFVASSTSSGFNFITWTSLPNTSTTADILVWGAQLEASSYPTSYIPTTSSSATRVADACFKTGISSLIGQTSGTIFLDGYFQPNDTGWGEVVRLQGATSGDSIVIYFNPSGQFYFEMAVGGVSQASGYLSYAGGRLKIAIAYANNDVKIYINGTEDFADTSASIPTCSSLYLLYGPSAQNKQGQVNQFSLFKTRLTNAELASLTTI